MTIGDKILNMRKARGWSQEELADRVGVTRQAISRWESDSAKPDADNIITICDLFGVSADYLLRDMSDCEPTLRTENASQKGIRAMPQRRWIGGILTLTSVLVLLVIWMMSLMYPVSLDPEDKLPNFLYSYKLNFVWYIAWFGLATGLWKALSPKPLNKYASRECVRRLLGLPRQGLKWLADRFSGLYAFILSKCEKK